MAGGYQPVQAVLTPCRCVWCSQVRSAFTASVWDIKVAVGDKVSEEDILVVLEAMKMESPVVAPCSGTVKAVRVAQGQMAPAGTLLVVIEKDA